MQHQTRVSQTTLLLYVSDRVLPFCPTDMQFLPERYFNVPHFPLTAILITFLTVEIANLKNFEVFLHHFKLLKHNLP